MSKPRAFVLRRRETIHKVIQKTERKAQNCPSWGNSCLTSTDTGLSSAVVFEGKTDFQLQMPEIQTCEAVSWEPPAQRDPSAEQSHDWAGTAECSEGAATSHSCSLALLLPVQPAPALLSYTGLPQELWDHIKALLSALGFCAISHSLFFRATAQCLEIIFCGHCFK